MKSFATFTIFVFLLFNKPILLPSQSDNVGVGVQSPQEKFHVSGNIRSDSLSGPDNRLVIADTNGVIQTIDKGKLNEVLVQSDQGPIWKSNSSMNNENDCLPFSCPTTFSLTSQTGMYFGTCLRYCGTLEEDGFTDWRVPTIDEALMLAPFIPVEIFGIWTRTRFIFTADPSWPGSERLVTFNLTTGDMTVIIAVNQTIYCKCVR